MKTKMCVTSLISYFNIANELGKRQREVLLGLRKCQPANNLMISKQINVPLQSVCGRMNELRKLGIVIYHHSEACPYTKHSSRFFIIKSYINDVMN